MADKTKLADSFIAWRLTLDVKPSRLKSTLNVCKKMGLFPKPCGFQDGRVMVQVLVPDIPSPLIEGNSTVAKNVANKLNVGLYRGVRVRLICPPAAA